MFLPVCLKYMFVKCVLATIFDFESILEAAFLERNNLAGQIPRKLQHTPGAHPRQSPYPTMKGFPLQPIGNG